MSDKKKTCFVITPIGDDNSDIRRHIDGIIDQAIKPAIGEKYEISVSHRDFEIGSINDRIVKRVYESDLVIANLTNTNPNVMYELAIRYSSGKPAIVIAEKGTKLPFDVIDENTIFYINDPSGANELKDKICETEKRIDYKKKDYGPIYKAINKIPLYNEVESGAVTGEDVSSGKMMQYIIDRLDTIEKNMSTTNQSITHTDDDARCEIRISHIKNIGKEFILDGIEKIIIKYDDIEVQVNIDHKNNYSLVTLKGPRRSLKRAADEICNWASENNMICRRTSVY